MGQVHFARRAGLLVAFMTGAIFAAPALTAPASAALRATGSGPGGVAPLTSTQAAALSTNVTDRVIVVLKDQLSAIPDSPAHAAAAIRRGDPGAGPFLAEVKQTDATHVTPYSLINAFAATVSPGEAQRLAQNPDVASVVPDEPIPVANTTPTMPCAGGPAEVQGRWQRPARGRSGAAQPAGGAVDPRRVESGRPPVGPGARLHGRRRQGRDSSPTASTSTTPTSSAPTVKPVFVDYQDFSGTGTSAPTDGGEAFVDASSIAAQGREVYNLQDFNPSLPESLQHPDPGRRARGAAWSD